MPAIRAMSGAMWVAVRAISSLQEWLESRSIQTFERLRELGLCGNQSSGIFRPRGSDRQEQIMTRAFLRCAVVLVLAMAAAIAPATAPLAMDQRARHSR